MIGDENSELFQKETILFGCILFDCHLFVVSEHQSRI